MQKQSSKNTYMTREPFNRPPRILLSPPQETIEMPPPPTREEIPPATGWWQITIALIMITALLTVYLVVNHAPFQQVAMLLPLAIMSVLSPVGTIVTGSKKKKIVQQKNRAARRAFKTVLAQIREQLQKYADEQRQIALLSNPAPEMLEARIKERSRLWERRPADPDFLAARVGIGRTPSTVIITNVPTNPIDVAGEEARALARDFTIINDIPCTIAISKVKSLGISGAAKRRGVHALAALPARLRTLAGGCALPGHPSCLAAARLGLAQRSASYRAIERMQAAPPDLYR